MVSILRHVGWTHGEPDETGLNYITSINTLKTCPQTIRGPCKGHEIQPGINTYSTDPIGLVPALLVAGLENPENPKGLKDIRNPRNFPRQLGRHLFLAFFFFTKDLLPCDFEDSGVPNSSSFRKIHHPWRPLSLPQTTRRNPKMGAPRIRTKKGDSGLENRLACTWLHMNFQQFNKIWNQNRT